MSQKLYAKALEKFGVETQILMCLEEMSELQKELCKDTRNQGNVLKIAEEIADVTIMLEQMIQFYACENLVDVFKKEKLDRLADLLEVEE